MASNDDTPRSSNSNVSSYVSLCPNVLYFLNSRGTTQWNMCRTIISYPHARTTHTTPKVAALTFIQDSEVYGDNTNLRERIWDDVTLGIQFLLDAQQTSTDNNMRGAVPAKYPYKKGDDDDDDMEVRVDYVQHSMSAVIAYEQMITMKGRLSVSSTTKYSHEEEQDGMLNLSSSGGIRMLFLLAFLIGCTLLVIVTLVIFRVYYPKLIRLRRRKRRD